MSDPAMKLVGIWGSEQVLGPAVRGELVLAEGSSGWRASIGSFEASADVGF